MMYVTFAGSAVICDLGHIWIVDSWWLAVDNLRPCAYAVPDYPGWCKRPKRSEGGWQLKLTSTKSLFVSKSGLRIMKPAERFSGDAQISSNQVFGYNIVEFGVLNHELFISLFSIVVHLR